MILLSVFVRHDVNVLFRLLILSYGVQVLFEAFGVWRLVFSIYIRFFYHFG